MQVFLGILLAGQSKCGPAATTVHLPPGTCGNVAELLDYLGLSPTLLGMIVVNGERAGLDTKLPESGLVYLFPCLAGG
ncbi:MAG: MoaD/ThiS family protein [Desulfurispora sp.]